MPSIQGERETTNAYRTDTAHDMTVAGTSRQRQVATTVKSALSRAPHDRWATRVGRSPGSRLERLVPAFPRVQRHTQWHNGRSSPLTVAGAAAACWQTELRSPNHRVPFSPTQPESPAGTDTSGIECSRGLVSSIPPTNHFNSDRGCVTARQQLRRSYQTATRYPVRGFSPPIGAAHQIILEAERCGVVQSGAVDLHVG